MEAAWKCKQSQFQLYPVYVNSSTVCFSYKTNRTDWATAVFTCAFTTQSCICAVNQAEVCRACDCEDSYFIGPWKASAPATTVHNRECKRMPTISFNRDHVRSPPNLRDPEYTVHLLTYASLPYNADCVGPACIHHLPRCKHKVCTTALSNPARWQSHYVCMYEQRHRRQH